MRYLDAVVTCWGYADYLSASLGSLQKLTDSLLVVTHSSDSDTQAVCRKFEVECLPTKEFTRYGAAFNKGAAINAGLDYVVRRDWILIVDADIYAPRGLREKLESYNLDESRLYGADRLNCLSYSDFSRRRETEDWDSLPKMPRIRVAGSEPPPGYFQLFHKSVIPTGPFYEDNHRYADRTDLTFARRFDARAYLPWCVVHLDAGTRHSGGANWKGRTSPRFGPSIES